MCPLTWGCQSRGNPDPPHLTHSRDAPIIPAPTSASHILSHIGGSAHFMLLTLITNYFLICRNQAGNMIVPQGCLVTECLSSCRRFEVWRRTFLKLNRHVSGRTSRACHDMTEKTHGRRTSVPSITPCTLSTAPRRHGLRWPFQPGAPGIPAQFPSCAPGSLHHHHPF